MKILTAKCYLVIEATWARSVDRVTGFRVVSVRANKPKLSNRQYAIKIDLSIPASVFQRLIPSVALEVLPDQLVEPDVAVLDPADGEA